MIKHGSLHDTMFSPQNHFYHSAWFVNEYILMFESHNQLHMYGFF